MFKINFVLAFLVALLVVSECKRDKGKQSGFVTCKKDFDCVQAGLKVGSDQCVSIW